MNIYDVDERHHAHILLVGVCVALVNHMYMHGSMFLETLGGGQGLRYTADSNCHDAMTGAN